MELLNKRKRPPLPSIPGLIPYAPTGKCPVLKRIPSRFPLLDTDDILGYKTVDVEAPQEHYCLLIQHSSTVSRRLLPGDLLLIHAQEHAEKGQLVISCAADSEPALKRLHDDGEHILGVATMIMREF